MFKIKIETNNKPKWLLWSAIIFLCFFILVSSSYAYFEYKYKNKIYPGVNLNGINLGGLNKDEGKKIINKKINKINQEGIILFYADKETVIKPIVASLESDLAYEIITFDINKTTNEAYGVGRSSNFLTNLYNKLNALLRGKKINIKNNINTEEIFTALKNTFSEFEMPAENAKLTYDKNNSKFKVEMEKLGKVVNYSKAIKQLNYNLTILDNSPIELLTETDYPEIYKEESLNIDSKAKNILKGAPFTLNYKKNKWDVDNNLLAEWLGLRINQNFKTSDLPAMPAHAGQAENKIIVGLNFKIVEDYLNNDVVPIIDKEPIEAKFKINNGRVTEFQTNRDGVKLNIAKSFEKIESELIKNSRVAGLPKEGEVEEKIIELVVNITKSPNSTGEINDLGIKEVAGIGESDFSGSPKNRRHNIKIGADTLNGILIEPGEEFSLLNALGNIDASSGYLQELVIKNNKTIPEYGGGLCQIGTTMFRAALATGLPITQRRNHSYRVSYYEPAGTDATIYDPWPDFRFMNDTGHHILIQSRIEGNNLYFDFWGTDDGRVVEQTEPEIYNIVKPAETKLIETLDLAPGEKKCTERAHNGADAHFDYKVTYANGEVKEKEFTSHYVPWQEVCLIGVEELSKDTDTSTEEDVN